MLTSSGQALPALSAATTHFAHEADSIAAARAQTRQLLQQHGTLLELLELGALLGTCVRTGCFDEALEVEAVCARLAAAAPDVPLAGALAAEGRAGLQAMLAALLGRLRGPAALPDGLRCVGLLRRLGALSEPQLRLAFLRGRHAHLATALAAAAAAPSLAPAEAAKRVTDVYRQHCFDGVMQFRAIFAEDGGDGALVAAWAAGRARAFLAALSASLERPGWDGGALAGVWEHAAYCAASLGRVGLDFRPLLPPPFEAAAAALAQRAFCAAGDAFDAHLDAWLAAPPQLAPALGPERGGEDGTPPAALLAHPPAAALVNGVLAALNELRHVAPALPAVRAPAAAALHEAIAGAAATLARHRRALPPAHAPALAALATALAESAAPYCAAAFGRVFPGGADAVDAVGAAAPARELAQLLVV